MRKRKPITFAGYDVPAAGVEELRKRLTSRPSPQNKYRKLRWLVPVVAAAFCVLWVSFSDVPEQVREFRWGVGVGVFVVVYWLLSKMFPKRAEVPADQERALSTGVRAERKADRLVGEFGSVRPKVKLWGLKVGPRADADLVLVGPGLVTVEVKGAAGKLVWDDRDKVLLTGGGRNRNHVSAVRQAARNAGVVGDMCGVVSSAVVLAVWADPFRREVVLDGVSVTVCSPHFFEAAVKSGFRVSGRVRDPRDVASRLIASSEARFG